MNKQHKVHLDSEAWIDPTTDVVYVRVRQYLTNPNGSLCKKGFMFKATSEILSFVPEACEYPTKNPTKDDLISLETHS